MIEIAYVYLEEEKRGGGRRKKPLGSLRFLENSDRWLNR